MPFGSFSALTHAFVELLMKMESHHKAFGPKMLEVVTVIAVDTNASVNFRILLESDDEHETVCNAALPL